MTGEGPFALGLFGGLCPSTPTGGLDALGCLIVSWELPILVILVLVVAVASWGFWRKRERQRNPKRYVLPSALPSRDRPSGVVSATEPVAPGPHANGLADAAARAGETKAGWTPLASSEPNPPVRPMVPVTDALGDRGWNAGPAEVGGAIGIPTDPSVGGNGRINGGAPEGTLQLLPARLEIERGPGRGEHVRFVRLATAEQEFTVGRSEGPPHRHVQLNSPSVSRLQARLWHRGGHWSIENESTTNPTVHNGRTLDQARERVALDDGDRIEMGDVVFIFRAPKPTDRLALRSSWYTDRGRRSVNQDAVLVKTLPDGRELAAVCDGIGSHAAGGVASHIALDALVANLTAGSGLVDGVRTANAAVLRAAEESPEREGMGTTMVALLRNGNRYEIANVGDSRAYRIDDSGIRQVTKDHSFMAEALRDGRMTRAEAERSPWRNAVTRNLGADSELEVDLYGGFDALDPFTVVLCTDGVHGVLDAEEILRVARNSIDVRALSRALGEDALVNGGEDNVAVAALRFGDASPRSTIAAHAVAGRSRND